MARQIESTNTYKDILLKLIPSEIVAAFIVIDNSVSDPIYAKWIMTFSAVVLAILTPLYLWKIYGVRSKKQLVFTTLSLPVWLYSIGGPFRQWHVHNSSVASAGLVLWTLFVPLVFTTRATSSWTGQPSLVPGNRVRLPSQRQKSLITSKGVIDWEDSMDQFLGVEATVTAMDPIQAAVRLSTDKGAHAWAVQWLQHID